MSRKHTFYFFSLIAVLTFLMINIVFGGPLSIVFGVGNKINQASSHLHPIRSAEAQTSLIVGGCNLVNQNITIGESSVINQVVDCIPSKPEDAFRVRYVWLNDLSISFLIAGHIDEGLRALVGDKPIIARNQVYDELIDIWDKFAVAAVRDDSGGFYSVRGSSFSSTVFGRNGTSSHIWSTRVADIPINKKKKLKFYSGGQPFIWPLLNASTVMRHTEGFPSHLRMTYGTFQNESDFLIDFLRYSDRRDIISHRSLGCFILYKYVEPSEYESYWHDISEIVQEVERDADLQGYVNPSVGGVLDVESMWQGSVPYDSLAYFARDFWPTDFLVLTSSGGFNGCYEGSFGFAAHPRKLFVQLAVIQAKSGGFDLRAYKYRDDRSKVLRKRREFRDGRASYHQLGELDTDPGRSVVIPISIELRYVLDEYPFRFILPNEFSRQAYRSIKSSQFDIFAYDPVGPMRGGNLKKSRKSFQPPAHRELTQTYIYGPAIQLQSITVGDEEISVREAPSVAAVMNGEFEEGSCPFLYFRKEDGSLEKYGRILIGAHSKSRKASERIRIPRDAISVILQEEEPEISYFDHVNIVVSGTGETVRNVEKLRLDPQTGIEISLPQPRQRVRELVSDSTARGHLELEVRGFYRPLY